MMPESQIVDQILRQLKDSWNIEVSRNMVAQQVRNMDRKLQIMNDLKAIHHQQLSMIKSQRMVQKQRQLKSQLADLSIEDNKIVLDRLAEL